MIAMKTMMKKTMITKMRTAAEADMEVREEAKAIMEAEEAVAEAQEDIVAKMKITMTKIMTRKTMMMTKMMIEVTEEEAAVEVQIVVPAEDLAL